MGKEAGRNQVNRFQQLRQRLDNGTISFEELFEIQLVASHKQWLGSKNRDQVRAAWGNAFQGQYDQTSPYDRQEALLHLLSHWDAGEIVSAVGDLYWNDNGPAQSTQSDRPEWRALLVGEIHQAIEKLPDEQKRQAMMDSFRKEIHLRDVFPSEVHDMYGKKQQALGEQPQNASTIFAAALELNSERQLKRLQNTSSQE